MSRVCLLTADKPLPLCDKQAERTSTVVVEGKPHTISFVRGFRVAKHAYYRYAVDELALPMKQYQYELEVEAHEDDFSNLKAYLTEQFSPGETVELWNLWVGVDRSDPLFHYRGKLTDFDMETLEQFLNPLLEHNKIGQCQMTITI